VAYVSTNLPEGFNVSRYVNHAELTKQLSWHPGWGASAHFTIRSLMARRERFVSWSSDRTAAQQLLVSPQQPVGLQLLQAASDQQGTKQLRIHLSWQVAVKGLPVEQFRLYVAG